MHGQAAAEPADHHEQVDELRPAGEQFAELVDDHQQRGQRGQVRAGLAGLGVVPHRRVVAGRAQQFLAPHQFAVDRVGHPVDQRQVLGQVGDHRAGVRQIGHAGEGRAALEVDQRQVHRLGRVGHGEAGHQGAQQFALAGPGRADDQAVRTHAALGRLLEVQLDRPALRVDAEWHAQPLARRPGLPADRRVHVPRVGQAEQGGQREGVRQRGLPGRDRAEVERGQRSGQRFGFGLGQPVGHAERAERAGVAVPADPHAHPLGGHVQGQRVLTGRVQRHLGQFQHGHPVHPGLGHQPGTPGRAAPVHHHQDVRDVETHPGLPGERGPLAEFGAEQVGERVEVAGHQPDRAHRVGVVRVVGVRQPLQPLPVGTPVAGEAQRDPQVGRRLQGRRLRQQRADQIEHPLPGTAHHHPGEGPQRDRHGQVGHGAVGADEVPQRRGGHRVQVLQRHCPGWTERGGQLVRAPSDAQLAEGGIGPAPLPQPLAAREGPQLGGVGLARLQDEPLPVGGLVHLLAQAGEVALVVAALLVDPLPARLTAAGQ